MIEYVDQVLSGQVLAGQKSNGRASDLDAI